MAVPGRLDDELSRGCNALIAQGAGVILSAESFCEQIFPDYRQQKKRKALHITLAPSEKLVWLRFAFKKPVGAFGVYLAFSCRA